MPRRLSLTCALAAFIATAGCPSAAFALPEGESGNETPLEMAREESSVKARPRTAFAVPAGTLRLNASELLAAYTQTLRFSLTLDRAVRDGRLELTLPGRWTGRSGVSGLRYARVPVEGVGTAGRAATRRAGDAVTFRFEDARAGDVATFELTDNGIPAGTYELPYRWRETGEPTVKGTVTVIFYAPTREAQDVPPAWSRLASPGLEKNATDDASTESETFITVVPGDRRRLVVGANGGGGFNAWITNDGGLTFTRAPMPSVTDAPAEATPEMSALCCDPMSAADAAGNLWYGGLSYANGAGNPSRIVVGRIAPGAAAFEPQITGLPVRTSGTQDKPMMTIDNAPASPRFGRLYVVWDEPFAGGINVVLSQCDTRAGGALDAARCDNADNWSAPVSVTPATGSYIYADVAASPDGTVNVVWWDYSSATNAIRGDTCGPAADCASVTGWNGAPAPQTIATLDSTGGFPFPFACPILAQPGGRASPAPQIDVDRSGGPQNGRVYVTWSDLTGAGTTRCADNVTPVATHRTLDSYVASKVGGLPGGAAPSSSVATNLLSPADGNAGTTDDWFTWLAVDQTTGQAWTDFYSTRDDPARKLVHFYVRPVTPGAGTTHTLGTLTKVSGAPSNYSTAPCCTFGNDYGDYSGIDATQGMAFPVWSDKRAADPDGEAFTFVKAEPLLVAGVPQTVSDIGGDGDGILEPGEPFTLTQPVKNVGSAPSTGTTATLLAAQPTATVTQATSAYPDLAIGATAANTTAFAGTVAAEATCGAPVVLDLRLATAQGPTDLPIEIPTGDNGVCTPPPAQPVLTGSTPASGTGSTTPTVVGTAPAGSTVRLYTGGACTGTPAATGTDAALAAPGLPVTVPSGQTTAIRATATRDGLTSVCSAGLDYSSSAPPPAPLTTTVPTTTTTAPTIPAVPPTPDTTVTVTLSAAAAQQAVRAKALKLTATCPLEACTVNATGRVRILAPKAGGQASSRTATSVRRTLVKGRATTLMLKLSAATRRAITAALRRTTRNRVTAALVLEATDVAGNRQVKRKTVRLRR